jgi:hypothetical protein
LLLTTPVIFQWLIGDSNHVSHGLENDTAFCAEIEPTFLLRAALRATLSKNVVPHALAKYFGFPNSGVRGAIAQKNSANVSLEVDYHCSL